MTEIKLKIPEFTKLMREYSKANTGAPVEPGCWRAMKRTLVENKRLIYIQVAKNCLRFFEAGDFPGASWPTSNNLGLANFIEWILAKQDMISTSTNSNSATINTDLNTKYGINTVTIDTNSWNLNDMIINGSSCYPPGIYCTSSKSNESNEEKKEKKSMFNFDFGKVTSDRVRFSMYGIAVKNVDGRYVAYDTNTHSVMDVEILNMPCGDMLYKMPVAIKDIKAGDVVIHNKVPMFVIEVHDSTLKVVDIHEGTEKEIYLTKSPFGFNFATKVVSLIDFTGKADADNPFGNMLPFMLMSDSGKMDDMLPLMFLMKDGKMDMSNPMMMYFMLKDNADMKDLLPLMLMSNG